jgi:hypothetical protein
MRLGSGARALLGSAALTLAACGSILQLDELEKVDCVEDCGKPAGSSSAGSGSGGTSAGHVGQGGTNRGGSSSGAGGTTDAGSGGKMNGSAGTSGTAGTAGTAGSGNQGPCPGGPAPPTTWQEHWYEHAGEVTLVGYDDCVAVYFDADMDPSDAPWLQDFMSKAWTYNLETYGNLDQGRFYAIFHQNKYVGCHYDLHYEGGHDFRSVIDCGLNDWAEGDYEMPARALSYVVEQTAGHAKRGSPASWLWQNAFSEIYLYDLYVGLGMQDLADSTWDDLEPTHHDYPFPPSYWFADYYYPVWRDHGETQVLAKFFALLREHYPVSGDTMPDMTWGEYIHFVSGAAGADVEAQATYAFGWTSQWTQELNQARADYPQITY